MFDTMKDKNNLPLSACFLNLWAVFFCLQEDNVCEEQVIISMDKGNICTFFLLQTMNFWIIIDLQ